MPRKPRKKPVVTLREAAEMFGVSVDALRQAVLSGRVPAMKSGAIWLLRPQSVAYAIKRGKMRKGRIPEAGET